MCFSAKVFFSNSHTAKATFLISGPFNFLLVSYHCQWADASKTILNVTAIEAMNSGGIMTWDTQKYEDGEDPNIDNNTCIVTGAGNITMLKFQVDPDALSQPCGVRVVSLKTAHINRTKLTGLESQHEISNNVVCATNSLTTRIQSNVIQNDNTL